MFESENEVMSANEVADALHVGLNTTQKVVKSCFILFRGA